jgi:hypothetical protein
MNKKISTPIAIGIIFSLSILLVGIILIYQTELDSELITSIQSKLTKSPKKRCKLAGDSWMESKNCCCPIECLVSIYEPEKYPQECLCCNALEIKDENADWKTYTNKEYGFEVNYPENYYIRVTGNSKKEENGLTYEFDLSRVDISKEPESVLISIHIVGPDFVLGSRDWEDFKLGGIDGKISYNWEKTAPDKIAGSEIILTSKNNQKFYIVTKGDPVKDEMLNQILSTFKFLN